MTKTALVRFVHILQSINHITSFVALDPEIDELRTAQAIHYELVLIGEAARHVPESFHRDFSDIPWKKMIALRNVLTHEYWKVKQARIKAAIDHLPALKERLEDVVKELEHRP